MRVEGLTVAGQLSPRSRRGVRDRLADAVREAGALALRDLPRRRSRRWTKGKAIRRSARPTSRSTICCASGSLGQCRTPAGCRRKPPTIRARLDARRVWIVDPIDGTRAFIAGRAGLDDLGRRWSSDGRRSLAALYAPVDRRVVPGRRRAAARRSTASPIAASAGDALAGARVAGPKRSLERLRGLEPADRRAAARSIRWRCGSRASRRARSTPPSPSATATTGTLRQPIFWCTKPAA